MNKIEAIKQKKDGLDVLQDVARFAQVGWEAIPEDDRERLKWTGVFFRKQTPGNFMMRVRIPNGISSAEQFRTIAEISEEFGKGFADITTRQQLQLRWFKIENVPEIWRRLEAVGLVSLQTGMDNIRNVVGCPAAGLTPNELFDASAVAREFTQLFVGNKEYTNLPRKFNVTITACKENCTHAETQDLALTPAVKEIEGQEVSGFNVAAGGKMGSGGYRMASPLNLFAPRQEAAEICSHVVRIFRDHGFRELRTKARLAFLLDDWGVEKFRKELERRADRLDRPLLTAGKDVRSEQHTDHVGIYRQKQPGLNYVGLAVPVGRITGEQLLEVADLAERYGNGLIRITTGQNLIIPNVADADIGALTTEPLLKELRYDPSEIMRGLVSCTGMDYCHFALIETKHQALRTAGALERELGKTKPVSIHWSGCPAGCANQAAADIGLIGKNIKINGQVEEAVDVYLGGSTGPAANPPVKIMEDVPCNDLPEVLRGLVRHGAFQAMRQQLRKIPQLANGSTPRATELIESKGPAINAAEIAEGSAKLVRMKGEEMAVFRSNGHLYGIQNICPHEGGQLCKGWLENGEVVCPLHGYKFDLKTGTCSTDPKLKVKVFRLVVQGKQFTLEA
jgi:ferredoxin-nitrite reductase